MAKKSIHVVPHQGAWAVRSSGSSKASAVLPTQAKAISAGTTQAKNAKTELFIHGRKGQIRERNSFGGDPFPPQG